MMLVTSCELFFFLVHFDWFGFLVGLFVCIGIIITILTHC